MTTEQTLPTDWVLETEDTTHDTVMGRDYTTVRYRHERTRRAVYISEIIDGENRWKYNVHHSGHDGDLGTAADLDTAKGLAVAYIRSVASA